MTRRTVRRAAPPKRVAPREKKQEKKREDWPPPKTDRRVLRTKQALREALFELIAEKGYEAVSVEEITQRANLGRATFYLHYKDKEDLLLEQLIEMAYDRVQALAELPITFWAASVPGGQAADDRAPLMPLQQIFEHVAENAGSYRVLLRGEANQHFADRIRAIVARSIAEVLQARSLTDPDTTHFPHIPIELLAAYFTGALLNSILWWLEQKSPPSPKDMTGMFQQLFFPGVRLVFEL